MLLPRAALEARNHIEKKLILRVRIFLVVFVILLLVISYEIFKGYISFLLALATLLLGSASALLFVRRKKIYWQEETSMVIARMDRIGIGGVYHFRAEPTLADT